MRNKTFLISKGTLCSLSFYSAGDGRRSKRNKYLYSVSYPIFAEYIMFMFLVRNSRPSGGAKPQSPCGSPHESETRIYKFLVKLMYAVCVIRNNGMTNTSHRCRYWNTSTNTFKSMEIAHRILRRSLLQHGWKWGLRYRVGRGPQKVWTVR